MNYLKYIAVAGMALTVLFLAAPPDTPASDNPSAPCILPEGCMGKVTDDQVVIYYFTRKFHCQSCETVEYTLLETVRRHYAGPFSDGRLAMCVINVDDPVNRHFLEEYGIISNTIYLVRKAGGTVLQSKNLEDVWEIAQDPDTISRFLKDNLDEYMAVSGGARESADGGIGAPGDDASDGTRNKGSSQPKSMKRNSDQ